MQPKSASIRSVIKLKNANIRKHIRRKHTKRNTEEQKNKEEDSALVVEYK
jgi:hypothetical protein